MTDLLKLAERCENATGRDRELDEAIQSALFSRPSGRRYDYTSSLDAAMGLIGPGWYLGCLTERDEFNQAKACFTEVNEPYRDAVGTAAYLELALCAAALKARAASVDRSPEGGDHEDGRHAKHESATGEAGDAQGSTP